MINLVKTGMDEIRYKTCYCVHSGKGAQLTHADSNGLTPLHHAARLGRKEIVKYIVANST